MQDYINRRSNALKEGFADNMDLEEVAMRVSAFLEENISMHSAISESKIIIDFSKNSGMKSGFCKELVDEEVLLLTLEKYGVEVEGIAPESSLQ